MASPLDDDDLLQEILLPLPPQPSSLPRASLVCKRWRRLAADPKFLERHRGKPPLLGFFTDKPGEPAFVPALGRPDRVPLSVPADDGGFWMLLGCRHGRVLLLDIEMPHHRALVFDPVARRRHSIRLPPEFTLFFDTKVAVLCAAQHAHDGACDGDCPFKVVLVRSHECPVVARVYSSETGEWGGLVRAANPSTASTRNCPAVLAGGALYWITVSGLLRFDLAAQRLAVIGGPPPAPNARRGAARAVRGEGGGVGLAVLAYPSLQLWDRKLDGNALCMAAAEGHPRIHLQRRPWRYADDTNEILLSLWWHGIFLLHLESLEFRRLPASGYIPENYHPFTSFYTPGTASMPITTEPLAPTRPTSTTKSIPCDEDIISKDTTTPPTLRPRPAIKKVYTRRSYRQC